MRDRCESCERVILETGGVVTRCLAHERRDPRSLGSSALSPSAQRWIADDEESR